MRLVFALIFLSFSFSMFSQKKPKLVVGIVIDQMCYEYLYRFQSRFGKDGFLKLMNNGTHCRNTQYNFVPTYTGPGHASIYTGTTPSNHGIVANEWYIRENSKLQNCVGDVSVNSVGTDNAEGKCSPINLKCNTITDQLKLTYPKGKVISASIKDRGAILPGGHLSDGSFWYDYQTGKMITSSFFAAVLPTWVNQFNEKKYADTYLKQTWNTLYTINSYTASGPDNSPYEVLTQNCLTPAFPYDFAKICADKPSFKLFTRTPWANTFLTDFAISALNNEQLGTDEHTDFLAVSYSTPDIIGHAFGPYSVEIEDCYLRLDIELARLVKEIEAKVGKGNFVLFLTADHAVVPVPQYLVDKKMPGGYLYMKDKMESLKKEVANAFGEDLIVGEYNCNIYLNREKISAKKLNKNTIEKFVLEIVKSWEGVKTGFTATELEGPFEDNTWFDMIRSGYHYRESGDVLYILEPGFLDAESDTPDSHRGTSHGSAFGYDTHVPLIWFGAGIKKQEIIRKVEITDITATLVHILKLQNPNCLTGQPIVEIFAK